jgi:two-component sensor histidine kinase
LRDRHGDYRWVLGRALPMADEAGRITRWFGTCTDIHDHKMALEQRELISHELSHRIKNIFSVISGLISLSSRTHPELKPVADQLRERVMALGTAHDFVRPHSEASRPSREQSSLHGLVDELLAPYQSNSGERITISGDDTGIDDRSATPLALLFHELATNSAKYGALANPDGQITLSCDQQGSVTVLCWRARGADMPSDPATRPTGFGSRLIAMSVEQQLGGRIERIWHEDGLEAVVTVPSTSMRRD